MISAIETRASGPEIMDGAAGIDWTQDEYAITLRQLETINRLTFGYKPTLSALRRIARKYPGRKIRLLDLGFGYGDTLRVVEDWAEREGINIELYGIDLNPLSERLAREATYAGSRIQYFTGDALKFQPEQPYDVIINSLFMHHLNNFEIQRILQWMTSSARVAWIINDLHRHPVAYVFIKHATRLFRFNRLICHDAPLSVARGFTRHEWESHISSAGVPLEAISLRWHFPFRHEVLCDTAEVRRITQSGAFGHEPAL